MTTIADARKAFYATKPVSRGHFVGFEMREEGDAGVVFRGYASTTNDPYVVQDWLGEYTETIARGAFGKTLREQDDVRFLVNHEGVPLARTKSGTLDLSEVLDPLEDPTATSRTGLWCEARLDAKNPTVQEIKSAMDRGDLSEMSFAFQAVRQEWDEDYTERTVTEARLFDVSVVTYPANPGTVATLSERSAEVLAALDGGRPLTRELKSEIRDAIQQRDAVISITDGAITVVDPSGDDVITVVTGDEDEESGEEDSARSTKFRMFRLEALRAGASIKTSDH